MYCLYECVFVCCGLGSTGQQVCILRIITVHVIFSFSFSFSMYVCMYVLYVCI